MVFTGILPSDAAPAGAVPREAAAAAAPASAEQAARPDSAPRCLFEPRFDSAIAAALERMYAMDYAAADSALSGIPPGEPALPYFRGLILFNRFNDLGDTAALSRAGELWGELAERKEGPARPPSAPLELYRGLADLQLSYVASLSGKTVRAASMGRKATVRLRPLNRFAEAEAALALYDYYKAALLKGMDWIPFVKADPDIPLRRLETAVPASRYLADVLRTSLVWLHYDAGRHERGMEIIDGFLSRHPGNRTYRQAKADFLFRKGSGSGGAGKKSAGGADAGRRSGDLAAALALQEGLKAEYLKLAPEGAGNPPIGYLSAVGNLAKIHAALGNDGLLKEYLAVWYASQYRSVQPWLPASLRREVKSLTR